MPDWAANTDWYDAITNNAPISNHDVTLSGGTDNGRYFAGFGAFSRDGIVIYNYAKRYTGRFNSEFTILKDRLKVGENVTFSYSKNNGVGNLQEGSPFQMGP